MMKTITHYKTGNVLHIEIPNGIINIRVGLQDQKGRSIDSIEILPDDHFSGEHKVKLDGKYNNRLIRLKTVKCK